MIKIAVGDNSDSKHFSKYPTNTSLGLCEMHNDLARPAHDAAGLLLDLHDQIQAQHQALTEVSPQEPGG